MTPQTHDLLFLTDLIFLNNICKLMTAWYKKYDIVLQVLMTFAICITMSFSLNKWCTVKTFIAGEDMPS